MEDVDQREENKKQKPKLSREEKNEQMQEMKWSIMRNLRANQEFKIKYKFNQYYNHNPRFDLSLDGYVYFAQKHRILMKNRNPKVRMGEVLREIRR